MQSSTLDHPERLVDGGETSNLNVLVTGSLRTVLSQAFNKSAVQP